MGRVSVFSRKAMGYGAATLTLFILSLVLSSGLFLMISLIGMAVILLSLSFIPRRPEVTRYMDTDLLHEGDEVDVELKVQGKGGLGQVEVLDRLSPSLRIQGGNNHAFLPPGDREVRYTFGSPLRGYHDIGPTHVRRWDPLWFWYREGEYGEKRRITTFPGRASADMRQMLKGPNKQRPGDMHLRRVGPGKEFYSIRDYVTTDPFHTINWKAYARTRKLKVNQYEAESVTDLMFILDSRMVTRAGTMIENPLERSIRFCASLGDLYLTTSNRVGLINYSSSVNVLKTGGGTNHLTKLLHSLTDITPSGYHTLGATVNYSLPYIPPDSRVIVLSPLSEDPTVKEAVKKLLARGHNVVIVSPSGVEFERSVLKGMITPRYLLKKLSRINLIDDLRSMGARVLDWPPEKDVLWAVQEVLSWD